VRRVAGLVGSVPRLDRRSCTRFATGFRKRKRPAAACGGRDPVGRAATPTGHCRTTGAGWPASAGRAAPVVCLHARHGDADHRVDRRKHVAGGNLAEGLQRAQAVFVSIHSFEDLERIFLRGQALSYHTYRPYLTAVKQFYAFTGGLNPLQVTPAWIEMF